jgi:serine/threonine protein kinase/WD40 repeat protein
MPDSSSDDLAPAAEWVGEFLIVREVGRGGMGVVYEAEQVSLGRRVALKLLTQRFLRDDKQRRRFEREARAAARLHHTNIVPVHGYGEHEGSPYYVMQLIRGAGLDVVIGEVARLEAPDASITAGSQAGEAEARSLVSGELQLHKDSSDPSADRTGPLELTPQDGVPAHDGGGSSVAGLGGATPGGPGKRPSYWQSVARLGAQAAEALDYAHRQGVVHRDVKPSNLLLDQAGTVWVTDFGLAKAEGSDDLTRPGDVLGTLRYMAPEAFDGRADARSDVYSLGLTLYELAGLRPAFGERDRHRLIRQVNAGEPPRLSQVRPGVPRDLETVIRKATDRDPGRRYQTAGELAEDLRRFADDEPIRARRQSAAEAVWRLVRRHPGLAASVTVTVLALAAVAAVSIALLILKDQSAQQLREEQKRTAAARDDAIERGKDLTVALGEADRRGRDLAEALRGSARLAYSRGLQLAEAGEVGPGLLWMARALETVPPGGADLTSEIRLGIEAWAPFAVPSRGALRLGPWTPGRDILARPSAGGILGYRSERYTTSKLVSGVPEETPGPTLAGHGVFGFSADGRRLLARWGEVSVRALDAATGSPIGPPMSHPGKELTTAGFAPGGGLVYTLGDAQLCFWDPNTGKAVGPTRFCRAIRFWPEGKLAVVAGPAVKELGATPATLRLVSTVDGTERGEPIKLPFEASRLYWGDLADGGRLVVAQSDRELFVLDRSGKEVRRLSVPSSWVHEGNFGSGFKSTLHVPIATALSPDRRSFWLLDGEKWSARDVRTGKLIDLPPPEGKAADRLVVLGARRVLLREGGRLRLWDSVTGKGIGEPAVVANLGPVAFSDDGRAVVGLAIGAPSFSKVGMGRYELGSASLADLHRWDAETGKPSVSPLRLPNSLTGLAVSADGWKALSLEGERQVTLWDLSAGTRLGPAITSTGKVDAIGFLPGGRGFLVGSHEADGYVVRLYGFPGLGPRVGPEVAASGPDAVFVAHPAYSSDGSRYTAVTTGRPRLFAWESGSGKQLAEVDLHRPEETRAMVQRDNRVLADRGLMCLTFGTAFQLQDGATDRRLFQADANQLPTGAFSADGRRLVTRESVFGKPGFRFRYRIWDAATGRLLGHPVEAPVDAYLGEGWIGGHYYLFARASAQSPDGPAEIRDLETGRVVGKVDRLGQVKRVYVGPDGCALLLESVYRNEPMPGGGTRTMSSHQARFFRPPPRGEGLGRWIGDPVPAGPSMVVSPGQRVAALPLSTSSGFAVYSLTDGKRVGQPVATPTPSGTPAVDDAGELFARAVASPGPGPDSGTHVQVWDVRTGKPLTGRVRLSEVVRKMSFVPGSSQLVITQPVQRADKTWDLQVSVLDGRTGRHLFGPHQRPADRTEVSAGMDGGGLCIEHGKLLTLTDKGLESLDLVTGKSVLSGDYGEVGAVASHLPSGRVLTSQSLSGHQFLGEDGRPLGPALQGWFWTSISPDRRWVLGTRFGSPRRDEWRAFEVGTDRPVGKPIRHDGWEPAFNFGISPGGDLVVGQCKRGSEQELHWWDVATGKVLAAVPVGKGKTEGVSRVSFAPDGRTFVTVHTRSVTRWGVTGVRVCECRVWDTAARKLLNTITLPEDQMPSEQAASVSLSLGLLCYAVDTPGRADLYALDLRTGERRLGPLALPGKFERAEPTPDGRLLITLSGNEVRMWDLRTGRLLGRPLGRMHSFSIHPRGRSIVTCDADHRRIQEWSLPRVTDEPPAEITRRLEALTGLRLDPDGVAHPLPLPAP